MRVIKVLIIHLVFIGIFLLVLDRLAAVFLTDKALSTPRLDSARERTQAEWPLRADPLTGWALAPPPDTPPDLGKGFHISHTGIGLRWLPGTMDMGPPLVLLMLGDDVAFGPSVRLEEGLGGWIKRGMEEHLSDRTLAVANAAVPGYDALQMHLQFTHLTQVRPHLALFCYSGGQALSTEGPVRRPARLSEARPRELLYWPALTRVLFLGIDRLTGGKEVVGVAWRPSRERAREPDPEEFRNVLRASIAHADRHRIPLLMMSLGLPEACRSVLEAACAEARIAYVDGDNTLMDHWRKTEASTGSDAAEEGSSASTVAGGGDRAADPHAWWIRQYLRPRVASVFLNRKYVSAALLPTRLSYQVVGGALTSAIIEQDLFSWRHRVLR